MKKFLKTKYVLLSCLLAMTMTLGMTTGCGVSKYKVGVKIDQIEQQTAELDRIVCKAKVRPNDAEESDEWVDKETNGGTSFPIGGGYQVGLTHATTVKKEFFVMSPFGPYKVKRQVKDRTYWIGDKKIKLVAKVGDISIFKKDWESEHPYKLGTDPIVGTKVVAIGDSMLNVNNIKRGIVSSESVGERYIKKVEEFKRCFLHTTPTNGGDSGSPLLAMNQKGEYEVVGIMNASVPRAQGYNFALEVSYLKEVLAETDYQQPVEPIKEGR